MANRRIGKACQYLISDLMINRGWENKPKKIHDYIWNNSSRDEERPAPRTIAKYMAEIRAGTVALLPQRREFQYPRHMGSGDDQVPWELARYAVECLGFYLVNYQIRPSIGLTKQFASVAVVMSDPMGSGANEESLRRKAKATRDKQIAIMAEQFWYCDLVEGTQLRERPQSTYEELSLATRSWESSDQDFLNNIAESVGAKRWEMPISDFGFLRFMPVFKETFDRTGSRGWDRRHRKEQEWQQQLERSDAAIEERRKNS